MRLIISSTSTGVGQFLYEAPFFLVIAVPDLPGQGEQIDKQAEARDKEHGRRRRENDRGYKGQGVPNEEKTPVGGAPYIEGVAPETAQEKPKQVGDEGAFLLACHLAVKNL